MTGFATLGWRVSDALGATLSLKSVNHRFLDLHLRLPAGMDALEMQLRRLLRARLRRGHVELTLALERSGTAPAGYNDALVAGYLEAFRAARRQHNLAGEPDLNVILRIPGVMTGESRLAEEDLAAVEAGVPARLELLAVQLEEMRAREGAALAAELDATLQRLAAATAEVGELRAGVQQAELERLSRRLAEMLAGTALDRDRVLEEAALAAERSDVEEELARMRAHIDHFRALLEGGGEIGKKMDFLLQEMNREANTLLAKTAGVAGRGTRITELGLEMKADIERAREQVQNIE
jgi:uncharacterized protein (TIGR00255 family)